MSKVWPDGRLEIGLVVFEETERHWYAYVRSVAGFGESVGCGIDKKKPVAIARAYAIVALGNK